jgi:hypothetical protein
MLRSTDVYGPMMNSVVYANDVALQFCDGTGKMIILCSACGKLDAKVNGFFPRLASPKKPTRF